MLRPAITQLISKNDSYYSLVIGVASSIYFYSSAVDRRA